jgi:hypothetical protein
VSTLQATFTDGEMTATRPAHFFRDDGDMPETVTLKIHRPNTFSESPMCCSRSARIG